MNNIDNENFQLYKITSNNFCQNKFAVFAIVYLTALWLEMAEGWENPIAAFIGLVLLLGIVFNGINRLIFCIFIILNTIYFLYFHFPEVANHVNLIIFTNLGILTIAFYSWLRPDRFSQPQDYFKAIASYLRICLIAVYFCAGFHKLNTAFLNPYFSCSNSMFLGIVEALTSSILGIPVYLFLIAISILFLQQVIPRKFWQIIKQKRQFLGALSIILLALSCIALKLLFIFNLTRLIFPLLILATSIMVLFWELVGGISLFIPKLQTVMFFLSMFMHLLLSTIGFVDFGSFAFALWLTFIPQSYYSYLQQSPIVPFTRIKINRLLLYVFINVFNGVLSGIYFLIYPNFNLKAIAGILFIISVLIVVTPLVKKFLIAPNSWIGVAVINRQMPEFMYVLVALLFLYAATPYLGLRTAGNFSMFSNLRTEGETSNHLLLSSNPWKIWNYQEDVVKIIEINDTKAQVGHKYRPLKDHFLPVVEFRKLIYEWTKAEYTVPLIFEYKDRIYTTSNIVSDPVWRTAKRNWEMTLMDFRVIQPDNGEPNYCRW